MGNCLQGDLRDFDAFAQAYVEELCKMKFVSTHRSINTYNDLY
jgi:hypothetical protein